MVNYICNYYIKGIPTEIKLRHTGTWSAAARPSRRLCHRPAVFFRHLRLMASLLFIPASKTTVHFSNMLLFHCCYF